jgi:hypothetical protein
MGFDSSSVAPDGGRLKDNELSCAKVPTDRPRGTVGVTHVGLETDGAEPHARKPSRAEDRCILADDTDHSRWVLIRFSNTTVGLTSASETASGHG